eukprot:m.142581 g.142581  ORF g.142581 m.142581 type:complete len:656 (+) comp16163_c0_seq2:118-2085(+)
MAAEAELLSFGAFAAGHTSLSVDQARYKLVSEAYLYRFSSQVPKATLFGLLNDLYMDWRASHAQASGPCMLSSEQFQTKVLCGITQASRQYFSHHWDNLAVFHDVNRPAFLNLIQSERARSDKQRELASSPEPPLDQTASTPSSNDGWHSGIYLIKSYDMLNEIVTSHERVLVMFTADYCRHCKKLKPTLNRLSSRLSRQDTTTPSLTIAVVYGPEQLELRDRFGIKLYPTILLFVNGEPKAEYPRTADRTVKALLQFCLDSKLASQEPLASTASFSSGESKPLRTYTTAHSIDDWHRALVNAGIDMLDTLERDRHRVLASQKHDLRQQLHPHDAVAETCCGDSCPLLEATTKASPAHPVVVFTGGGIAGGKSTALNLLYDSDYWKEHCDEFVSIEADAIKGRDPLFQALKGVGQSDASSVVHGHSVNAAEDMLVEAANARQSIIFDGTMMWAPFVRQTVAMLRDGDWLYRKGPGYQKHKDGTITEVYWIKDTPCTTPQKPYTLVLLGVTLDPALAIQRAVVRWIITGRAPSTSTRILQSHRWFAEHVSEYIDLVDQAIIIDGKANRTVCPDEDETSDQENPEPPPKRPSPDTTLLPLLAGSVLPSTAGVVIRKASPNDPVVITSQELHSWLCERARLNTSATSASEMYQATSPT